MTMVDTSQRDAEGATMGKVRRPEVLSPPTSGKSCAENVVNIRRAQQTKERSSSASNQSTLPVDSAEDKKYSLRICPEFQDGGRDDSLIIVSVPISEARYPAAMHKFRKIKWPRSSRSS